MTVRAGVHVRRATVLDEADLRLGASNRPIRMISRNRRSAFQAAAMTLTSNRLVGQEVVAGCGQAPLDRIRIILANRKFFMKRPQLSDLVTGAVAGAVGTVAMDAVWWRRARNAGSEDGFVTWQFATGTEYDSFEDASAPAQMGQRMARMVGLELPVERAGLTTDVMHWATGIGWGTAAGALTAAGPVAAIPAGIAGGVAAIGTAYGVLGAAGIYQPVWEYDRSTLWKDLSAHLVFGTAVGVALFSMRKLRSS